MPNFKRFVVRIPLTLHAELAEWAEAEGRSLHGLILWILRTAVARRRRTELRKEQRDA